jgi:hypothetical protein
MLSVSEASRIVNSSQSDRFSEQVEGAQNDITQTRADAKIASLLKYLSSSLRFCVFAGDTPKRGRGPDPSVESARAALIRSPQISAPGGCREKRIQSDGLGHARDGAL